MREQATGPRFQGALVGLLPCLVALAAVSTEAHAALPGRVPSADLIRLAPYGHGRVDTAGPGLDAGLRWNGRFGFGASGCDRGGYAYGPAVHPQAALRTRVPEGSRRLDVILRPAHGIRDVILALDDQNLGTTQLVEGWQRVSVPLVEEDAGTRLLKIKFTDAGSLVDEGPAMPREVRGLVHTVAYNRQADPPSSVVIHPVTSHDVLWLEAGQSIDIPAPLQLGQALETAGIRARGDAAGLVLHLELVSVYGAVEKVIQWPAPLNVPWNLDLSRRNERTPVYLRLRVSGRGTGAVGLVRPTLTVAGNAPDGQEAGPTSPAPETLVLVVVRGLRMMDLVDSPTPQLPGLHGNVWATETTLRGSLTSVLTGSYAHTHGLVGMKDPLPTGLPLLGFTMRDTGRKTFLRAGYLPIPKDSPLWGGFDDIAFADPPERPPNADAVLTDALVALKEAGDGPSFAMVILDDIRRPYAARGDHWRKHWPPDAKTPWVPAQSRQAFRALDAGKMKSSTQVRAFERTLRSGKVDEVLEALDRFRRALREAHGPHTRLMVVGLGDTGLKFFGSRDPRALNVPLWVDPPLKGRHQFMEAADLTDIPATLVALCGRPQPAAYQGQTLTRWHPGAWSGVGFASRERRADLVASRDFVLTHARTPSAPYLLWKRKGATWVHQKDPSRGDAVWMDLLSQQLDSWRGAESAWRSGTYEPTSVPERPPGITRHCE